MSVLSAIGLVALVGVVLGVVAFAMAAVAMIIVRLAQIVFSFW